MMTMQLVQRLSSASFKAAFKVLERTLLALPLFEPRTSELLPNGGVQARSTFAADRKGIEGIGKQRAQNWARRKKGNRELLTVA
jgi:hypothetical protein